MLPILISQMKELGVIFYNCSCLVLDLQRIFALYSSLKFKSRVPQTWSKRLYGVYDNEKKLQLQLNETKSQAFVSVSCSSSPPPRALDGVGMFQCDLMLGKTKFGRSVVPHSWKSFPGSTLMLSRMLSL